jgi:hypothetical protein
MEDKIVVKFDEKKSIIEFDGQNIEVTRFIPGALQAYLIEQYIQEYFYSVGDRKILPGLLRNYLGAELHMKLTILDRLTNVQISNGEDIEYGDRICTELWGLVVQEIDNYFDFEESLSNVLKEVKKEIEIEKSVGGVIAGVADNINELLRKLNSISPEELKKLVEDGQGLLKGLEESPISGVFREAEQNKAGQS